MNVPKVEIIPVRVMHGNFLFWGYRIGNMAWITDMLTMPESEYELLNGLDVLVMMLCVPNLIAHTKIYRKHWTMQSVSELKKLIFIHMSHHMGLHSEVEKLLPPHVHFAYDGEVISVG